MPDAMPSVPDTADAVDLAEGDAVAQAMGGAAPADDAGLASPEGAAVESSEPVQGDVSVPPPSAPAEVDPHDLAPALDAAGIEHDLGSTGATGAPTGSEAEAETGEVARSGKSVDLALGVVRLGVGAALVAAPRWAGRIWVGPGADGPGSLVFARALGARDVALGLRILDGVRKGEPVRHWVAAGFAADAADVAAALVAGRHLTPGRRVAMPLIAGAVGALGVWSGRRTQG